jgi:hypothetical protein
MTYINHTNEELEFDIEQFEKQLARAQSEVTRLQRVLENAQAELARRKMEAFWQQNAGLRLAVGDALLVTDEAVAEVSSKDRNWSKGGISLFSKQQFLTISGIAIHSYYPISLSYGEGSQTGMQLDIARRMRLAYLQAHGEAVSSE